MTFKFVLPINSLEAQESLRDERSSINVERSERILKTDQSCSELGGEIYRVNG